MRDLRAARHVPIRRQNIVELGCDTRPALALIDAALAGTTNRDLIPSGEYQSTLLDIRNALVNN
jgi:hypothetical protein